MKDLLDTDTCIYALRRNPGVLQQLLSRSRSEIGLSVITEAELRTGAAKSSAPAKTSRLLEHFLAPLSVIEFASMDAVFSADTRAKLRAGTSIGLYDTLIAAQSLARKLILVPNNERELKRVVGPRIEN